MKKNIEIKFYGKNILIEPVYQDGKINYTGFLLDEKNTEKKMKFTKNFYKYINFGQFKDKDLAKSYKNIIIKAKNFINENQELKKIVENKLKEEKNKENIKNNSKEVVNEIFKNKYENKGYEAINFSNIGLIFAVKKGQGLTIKEFDKIKKLLGEYTVIPDVYTPEKARKLQEKNIQILQDIKNNFPGIEIKMIYANTDYGIIHENTLINQEFEPLNKFINSKKMKKLYEETKKNFRMSKIPKKVKLSLIREEFKKWFGQFKGNIKIDQNFMDNINLTGVNLEELKLLGILLTGKETDNTEEYKIMKKEGIFKYKILNGVLEKKLTFNSKINVNFLEKEINTIIEKLDKNSNDKKKKLRILEKLEVINKMISLVYDKYQKIEYKNDFINYYFQNLNFKTAERAKMQKLAKKYKFFFEGIPHNFYSTDKEIQNFLKDIKPLEDYIKPNLKYEVKSEDKYFLSPHLDGNKYQNIKKELSKPMDKNIKQFFERNINNIFKLFKTEFDSKANLPNSMHINNFIYIFKEFAPDKLLNLQKELKSKSIEIKKMIDNKHKENKIPSRSLLLEEQNINDLLRKVNEIIQKFGIKSELKNNQEEQIEQK